MNTKILLIIALLSLGACSSFPPPIGPTHSTFYDQDRINDGDHVSVFIDSYGDLYPNDGFPTDPNLAGRVKNGDTGSIFNQASYPGSQICADESTYTGTEAELLCDALPKTPCNDPLSGSCTIPDQWTSAQRQLWDNRAKEIYQRLEETGKDEILVLVHGFNNDFSWADTWYDNVVLKKVNELGHDPVVVKVFWEGFINGLPGTAWGRAQGSGPIVGFRLRQLYNALNSQIDANAGVYPKVRVLTHSSGAFVVASTFGNMYTTLPNMYREGPKHKSYDEYLRYRSDITDRYYRIPHFEDLRIAMVAPATAVNSFDGISVNSFAADTEQEAGILTNKTTILMTQNRKDKVLNKYFGLASWNRSGATDLGVDRELYCKEMRELLKDKDGIDNVYAFDFSVPGILNEHGMADYFNNNKTTDFLKLLFDEEFDESSLISCG